MTLWSPRQSYQKQKIDCKGILHSHSFLAWDCVFSVLFKVLSVSKFYPQFCLCSNFFFFISRGWEHFHMELMSNFWWYSANQADGSLPGQEEVVLVGPWCAGDYSCYPTYVWEFFWNTTRGLCCAKDVTGLEFIQNACFNSCILSPANETSYL